MNLVEYKLGNICEMLAPVGSSGVAEQFIRALDLQFRGPEFKSPPDRQLDLFSVVPSSTPQGG